MSIKRRLPRWVYALGIPHLTLWIIGLQMVVFAFYYLSGGGEAAPMSSPDYSQTAVGLVPLKILEGEFWRVFTFLIVPPSGNIFFLAFAWYFLYLIGTAMEAEWGSLRYTLFWFIGWMANLAVAFFFPSGYFSNGYLITALFLAFAIRFPHFEIRLFLILPIQVKYLAWVTGLVWALTFVFGLPEERLLIGANSLGLGIYYWRDFVSGVRQQHRRARHLREATRNEDEPFHVCAHCGATDQTHPERQFFYDNGQGICEICDATQPKPSPSTDA